MALAALPNTLDPRYATDAASSRLCRLLYAGLTDFDASARPVAALADWARLSPERYRFTLRADRAPFPDGRLPDAEDVAATYRSILDPATASPHRGTLAHIRDIAVLGPDTLEFRLTRPDVLFPGYLSLGVLPADKLAAGHDFNRAPFGSGPFRFVDRAGAGRLRLRRVGDGLLVDFTQVPDPTVRVLKLQRGEVDLLQNDLPPELIDYLAGLPRVRVERRPGTTFAYIGFQLEDPVVGRAAVRAAVAHAIDREAFVRHLFGGNARTAESILPPEHWAGHAGLPATPYDPARARTVLASIGYGPRRPLEIEYKTSSDPFRLRVAAALQAQLAEVGIRLRIRSFDWGTFFGDIKAGRFQMYSLAWVGVESPDIFRYVLHSEAVPPVGANRGRYASAAVDAWIEAAERAVARERSVPLFRRIQEQAHADRVYVPLWYEGQVAASGPRLSGYRLSPRGHYDGLADVELTGLQRRRSQ